ncbi:hypothetical protein ACS386_04025 [Flavobacteriaceae bacterium LMO-SS05]
MDYQFYIDYFTDSPFVIQLALTLIAVLVSSIAVLVVYLKIIRGYLRSKEQETERLKSEYEALLIEYLYCNTEKEEINAQQEAIVLKIKKAIQLKPQRKIVVSILYHLMDQVSGEMSASIRDLYHKTGLIDDALSRLHSKKWYIIAKGIGELSRFEIKEGLNHVLKFVKHPRREVRKQAHLYLVNLYHFEGLSFLKDIKTPISEWDQIQLLEILQKFEDQQICDIKPWLKSSNDTVVQFALKLAVVYNQFEAKDTLMELLSHRAMPIRVQTIEVLTHLYGVEAKELLKANFNELSIAEQVCFFGMLEKLVVPTDEPFIEKHLFHKNFEIQLLALKILKSINIDKFMGLRSELSNQDLPEVYEFVNNAQ